jgi:hypothetical protein
MADLRFVLEADECRRSLFSEDTGDGTFEPPLGASPMRRMKTGQTQSPKRGRQTRYVVYCQSTVVFPSWTWALDVDP